MSNTTACKRGLPVAFMCGLLLAACEKGPTDTGGTIALGPEYAASRIRIHSGNDQVAVVGSKLPFMLAVRVTDSGGRPVRNSKIRWAVEEGSGSVSMMAASAVTDFLGLAYAEQILGPDEGTHIVTATASDIPGEPQVRFRARAVTAQVFMSDEYDCWDYAFCSTGFSASNVVVPTGRTVEWRWGGQHNVTFEDDPTAPTSAQTQQSGRHFRTFTTPGTYRYRCTVHSESFTEGEVGTVTVQ